MTTVEDALHHLRPGAAWSVEYGEDDWTLVWSDDEQDEPSRTEIDEAVQELDEAAALVAYRDERAKAYPSIPDQLDMQYWDSVNGTTTWMDAIAAVKAEYPKPEDAE